MMTKTTKRQTNESRMSKLHKEHLQRAAYAVKALIKGDKMNPTTIKAVYDEVFREGCFPELKGKMDPRFDTTSYPKLPDSYFEKEVWESPMNWRDAKELAALAAQGPPLTRLLAAYIWKRGELDRVKPLLNGIKYVEKPKDASAPNGTEGKEGDGDSLAVMWQFGRHLASRETTPICDQHTFRAYVMLEGLQGSATVDLNQQKYATLRLSQIEAYVSWWKKIVSSNSFPKNGSERAESMYLMDQLLFSLGKAARPPRRMKDK